MFHFLFLSLFPILALATKCDDLFEARHRGLKDARNALSCYESSQVDTLGGKAHALSRRSYLKFYLAEYFDDNQASSLLEGIRLAEEGILLFGKKYDVTTYLKLPAGEKETLGWLLYNYGLTTSRYVELAGPLEAIRRMEDIKKSMNSIIRMKEEDVSFYGAHRTLGIFHMKVPAIAGGDIKLSEAYLTKAVNSTQAFNGLSLFPSNNVALGELYLKLNQDQKACEQIALVAGLNENDVARLSNGHILETRQNILKAKELFGKKCP